jgi:hypothetical protein
MSEPLLPSSQDEGNPRVDDGLPGRDRSAAPPNTVGDEARMPSGEPVQGMIPGRSRRRTKVERASMRILATGGIIGIATALGAVLVGNDVAGWIVGLAVGLTSVILAAVLWSSRQL